MNKATANLISAIIPVKAARKKWRAILTHGVGRSMRTARALRKLRKKDISPRYYLAICAIAKDEGSYFGEWIEWHRGMGVEKFYIYDNESTDNTREILAPYIESGVVDYILWPGRKQQKAVYADCLERRRVEARWIAFIDLDEFIVPVADRTIPEFLKRFEEFPAVEINWLVYGSGGAETREEGGVMERFRHHSTPGHPLNRHVKSIVNPRRAICMDAHTAVTLFGHPVDPLGRPVRKFYHDREPQPDVIRVNHYAVKSREEFLSKNARGRLTTAAQYKEDYFRRYDLNDTVDPDM